MTLLNLDYLREYLTNNQKPKLDVNGKEFHEHIPVPYRWTHGATDLTLGDGLLIYSIIHYMRAKVCVCLGSGGGFIPRIMTQARVDLYDSQIFEGNRDFNWGDIGSTYLVDAANGIISIHDTDESFEKDLIVTEDVKSQNHQDNITNGPSKLVKELSDDSDWEIFNFFNNGIFKTRPSSTGLTILQKCQK